MNASIQTILIILSLSSIKTQKFEYLNGLSEGESCLLSEYPEVFGICEKISNCKHQYESYRRNQRVLKICAFHDYKISNDVICCPQKLSANINDLKIATKRKENFSLASCKDKFLSLRKSKKNAKDLITAINNEIRTITDDDCMNIHLYGKPDYDCENREIKTIWKIFVVHGELAREDEWKNMAALGWTQNDGKIEYNCGGVIISDKFIITAAHCRYKGKNPDTIRVGDKFLDKSDDDDHSQQLKVDKFIPHPDYKSIEAYNDIAVIQTVEIIFFNEFVAPACIGDIDDNEEYTWSIAGFGQTENGVASKTLLQVSVQNVPNVDCNESFDDNVRVSKGILPSQVCTIGDDDAEGNTQDSCFGDSGGPVQYKEFYELKDPDYNQTLMKTVYEIPTVVGLVSFGSSCGLKVPSVNTKISFFREWIEFIVNNLSQ